LESDEFLQRLEELSRREAARSEQTGSPNRLLPGEDPASPYPEEAQQWVAVYRDLVGFKEAVVRLFQDKQERLPPAEVELEKDEQGLQEELERLRLHLRYWEERQPG
jgi:hypothetical protein